MPNQPGMRHACVSGATCLCFGGNIAQPLNATDASDGGDTAVTHTFKLGLSMPFGDGNSAASALNPLGSSAATYRAASWGDVLD